MLADNAVIVVSEGPRRRGLWASTWVVSALNIDNGSLLWQERLESAALPGGLLIDRDGRIVVVLQDGSAICYGEPTA